MTAQSPKGKEQREPRAMPNTVPTTSWQLLLTQGHSSALLSLSSVTQQRWWRSSRLNNAGVCVAPSLIYSVCGIHDLVSMLFRITLSQLLGVTEVNPKLVEALSRLRRALAHFSQLFIFNMVLVCQVFRNNKIHIYRIVFYKNSTAKLAALSTVQHLVQLSSGLVFVAAFSF